MQFSISKTGRLATLFGFLSSVALGCVISLGDGGKSSSSCPDSNSYLSGSKCFCEIGYDWCNPNDDADLTCCESATSAATVTATDASATGGTTSVTDGSVTDGGGTTSGTTDEPPTTSVGTTGEPLDCSSTAIVPRSCDPNVTNFLCVQADNADCGPEGSKYYVCDGGTWAQDPTGPTGSCASDGFDFAYGCTDNGTLIEFVCGNGPGTDCSGGATSCNGDNELNFCQFGKLGAVDCLTECMEVGDGGGVTYDFGYCGDQRGSSQCICCDEGEDDCPLGGESTGGGTSTGGGSSSTGG